MASSFWSMVRVVNALLIVLLFRQASWPPALSHELRSLRTPSPNRGQAKLQVLLRPWGAQPGRALPSGSTLGRLLARAPAQMRQPPIRLDARGRPKPVSQPRKPRPPKNRHPVPLQGFAGATVGRRHATHALEALGHLLPAPPRCLLTDTGAECLGPFQQRRADRGLTPWGPEPRSPNMNAPADRFNRTLQEPFVDDHEARLFDDLAALNRKLAAWLLADNPVLPPQSLGRQSPGPFLIHHHPECQRWWTHTLS